MNELDLIWSQMLDEAAAKARSAGKTEVARYLELKAANDELRKTGVSWLFDGFTEISAEAVRSSMPLTFERLEPYSFKYGNANIVGSELTIRYGVRCISIKAGWTRTPSDGFMRGGALAVATIKHFGMKKFDAELFLMRTDRPFWHYVEEGTVTSPFNVSELIKHFRLFLGK